MTTTRIVVKEYNSDKKLEVTYTIDQQISGSDRINVKKVFFPEGYNDNDTFLDETEVMNELTLKDVVIGLTNKIHIFSLAPADKKLFEDLHELPMCIEFRVEPGVNLSKVPIINTTKEECPICYENLFTTERGGPVVGLGFQGCGHKFHKDCLKSSLQKTSNKCPMCRRPITGFLPIAIEEESGGGSRRRRRRKQRTNKNKGKKSRKSKKRRK